MNLLELAAVLTLNSKAYEQGLDNAEDKAKGFGSKFASKVGTAAKVGVAALAAFGVSSVKTGMDFDKAMSQVAATMGKTVGEMTEETVKFASGATGSLRDLALEMGRNTAFSATQAAEALNYMALAGYDAQTSADMLPNVLSLAAAGNMELAAASDMVTDAQTALGLSLDQTKDMVDQMAMAASKSNTSVAQLGDAFLTVGGTAKSLSGGTVELSASLGILADNGIKASEGGTALRNILLSLSSTKAEKVLSELGVNAYDADGKMRPLKDTFGDLNQALDGMTEHDRNQVLSSMFNKVDLKSVNAMLGTNAERWDELTGAISDCEGAAEQMAETQLDNLAGDVTLLKSAFEGLQIAVSDMGSGVIREFVQGLTAGISALTEALSAGDVQGALKVFSDAWLNLHIYILSALTKAREVITAQLPQMIQSFMQGMTQFSAVARERAGQLVDVGLSVIKAIADGIIKNIPTFIQTVPTIISNFAGFINDNAPKIIEVGVSIIKSLVVGLIKAIPVLIANIPQILKAIWDVFMAFQWLSLGKNIVKGIGNGIKSMAGSVKATAKNLTDNVAAVIKGGFNAAKEAAVRVFELMKSGIKSKFESIVSTVKGFISKIKGMFPFSIGKIFTGLISLPKISVHKDGNGASTSASTSVQKFAKAMFNPYLFTKPTIFAEAGEAGDEMLYGRNALMRDIREAAGERSVNIYNTFYVDGAESPESYAMTLANELQLQMRTA